MDASYSFKMPDVWEQKPVGSPSRDAAEPSGHAKVWFCGRSLAGIAGSNPAGDICLFLVKVVCSQVEVSAKGWSPFQRSFTD